MRSKMRKVLIFTTDFHSGGELSERLKQGAVSVKFVTTVDQAIGWMKERNFDLLIVKDECTKEQLTELGLALWNADPTALAFVTPFEGEFRENPAYYKVLGFQPLSLEDLNRALAELHPGQEEPHPNSFPVLVVEDLDSPRDIICIFIESLGFSEVTGCASADEALKSLERDPDHYKCIVTDIRMPKISGKEFIEIVRSHPRLQHLPIIVLTAHGTLDMLVDCLRLGASGFLIKPPKKEDMMRELSRARRIDQKKEAPRLASYQEAEYIRKLVEEQKVT